MQEVLVKNRLLKNIQIAQILWAQYFLKSSKLTIVILWAIRLSQTIFVICDYTWVKRKTPFRAYHCTFHVQLFFNLSLNSIYKLFKSNTNLTLNCWCYVLFCNKIINQIILFLCIHFYYKTIHITLPVHHSNQSM